MARKGNQKRFDAQNPPPLEDVAPVCQWPKTWPIHGECFKCGEMEYTSPLTMEEPSGHCTIFWGYLLCELCSLYAGVGTERRTTNR